MRIRKSILWAGATLLAIGVLFASHWLRHEEAAPSVAVEPDLFPFLKFANGVRGTGQDSGRDGASPGRNAPAADTTRQAEDPHDKHAGAEGERSALARLAGTQMKTARLRAQGATEDEVYRLRAAALPAADADRLAALDRAESAWQARVTAYLSDMRNLPADSSGASQEQALQQLRNARFSPEEQERLAAYESQGLPHLTLDHQ